MIPPTLADVLAARKRIAPHLARTPLFRYPALDAALGCEAWVKHENYQPIGVFKVRGGVNLVAALTPEERRRGVVTASTGNHGQSIAYAASLFGARAVICVPDGANPGKVAAIRGFGAAIAERGAKFDDAVANAQAIAARDGLRFVHSANEPDLIAGVGTYALEMLEDQPALDAIVVPVGLGSGASGTCIVAKAVNPGIRVIAVQAAASRRARTRRTRRASRPGAPRSSRSGSCARTSTTSSSRPRTRSAAAWRGGSSAATRWPSRRPARCSPWRGACATSSAASASGSC
jgi:threonine dehydratase